VRSQAQVAAAFGLPDVIRIDLTSRCVSGAVKYATAWSSTGKTATVTGAHLAGQLGLPSRWMWRAVDSAAADPVAATVDSARLLTSPTVVLAPLSSPTSIALASNLATQRHWPLLLTASTDLTAATRAELVRRNARTVFAVGTRVELPDAVIAAADAVSGNVVRIGGASAVDLSVRVAARLARPIGTSIVVAPASNSSWVSLASAAAAAMNRPLLITPGGSLHDAYLSGYLTARQPSGIVLVGNEGEVSDSVLAGIAPISRASGANIVDTSCALAEIVRASTSTQRVTMSTAGRLTISLVSNPATPILVTTNTLSASTKSVLQAGVSWITVSTDLSPAVVTAARRA
jgi:putative cell wall-binding protein